MRTRTEVLGYEEMLAVMLGLLGSPVTVVITPTESEWTGTVATMSGVLCRGRRRRQTLGAVPEDPDHEVVVFWLDPEGRTSFAVGKRVFGGAKVERDVEGVTVSVVVGPNEVVVTATA